MSGTRAADKRRQHEPFRMLIESVQALEQDLSVPLPVLFQDDELTAIGRRRPPGHAVYALSDEDDTLTEADLAPRSDMLVGNLLATQPSQPTMPSDSLSIDIGAGDQRLLRTPTLPGEGIDVSFSDLDESVLAEVEQLVAGDPEEYTDRKLPAYPDVSQPTFVSGEFASSETGDGILTQLADARHLATADSVVSLPTLQPLLHGAHTGSLAVSRGLATGVWQQRAMDSTAFDELLDGPDAWFDLPSDEPLTQDLPTIRGTPVRPLPSRAKARPVVSDPLPPKPATGDSIRIVARQNLGAEFFQAAVDHIARGEYVEALARLAAAHNLEPENDRYLLLIEDVKAKL